MIRRMLSSAVKARMSGQKAISLGFMIQEVRKLEGIGESSPGQRATGQAPPGLKGT